MNDILSFLTRTRGRNKLDFTDILTYAYLFLGTFIMFGPVIWLIFSSFKTQAEIVKFPPRFLPYRQETVQVDGYDEPLPLYEVTLEDGTTAQLAQVRRIGLEAQLVDPANPDEIIKAHIENRQPIEKVVFSLDNYVEGIESFNFARYLRNSVVVTVFSTLLTLLINSMAAFALAKYEFKGRNTIFFIMLSTLMVPLSVILVPVFLVITTIGWNNNLLGVIIPAAATPTGLFLLRQYMLSIPDELLDAARIDGASEWRIYAQIILPLARPALAVLTIFSVMWRWNDFLWPLIVLSRNEFFTLQIGLNSFQGELNVQWNLILAMTVLTLLPITAVFAILQKNITTGIATTGMK
ncbi:MAG: carbohydrate ABC transporter permease [Anaerolineales bacterium]|jgi:alpha-1,4-digalacturonate transport system permease protein